MAHAAATVACNTFVGHPVDPGNSSTLGKSHGPGLWYGVCADVAGSLVAPSVSALGGVHRGSKIHEEAIRRRDIGGILVLSLAVLVCKVGNQYPVPARVRSADERGCECAVTCNLLSLLSMYLVPSLRSSGAKFGFNTKDPP